MLQPGFPGRCICSCLCLSSQCLWAVFAVCVRSGNPSNRIGHPSISQPKVHSIWQPGCTRAAGRCRRCERLAVHPFAHGLATRAAAHSHVALSAPLHTPRPSLLHVSAVSWRHAAFGAPPSPQPILSLLLLPLLLLPSHNNAQPTSAETPLQIQWFPQSSCAPSGIAEGLTTHRVKTLCAPTAASASRPHRRPGRPPGHRAAGSRAAAPAAAALDYDRPAPFIARPSFPCKPMHAPTRRPYTRRACTCTRLRLAMGNPWVTIAIRVLTSANCDSLPRARPAARQQGRVAMPAEGWGGAAEGGASSLLQPSACTGNEWRGLGQGWRHERS